MCSDSIKGGILADEMGLGKTIEVIAMILAHKNDQLMEQTQRFQTHIAGLISQARSTQDPENMSEVKCYCRDPSDSRKSYIQCDICNTWQHLACVGCKMDGVPEEESYLCPDCCFDLSEKNPSSSTLIICPQAILQQWRYELIKRTPLNALKILIYEGITEPNRTNHTSSSTWIQIL